MYEKAFFYSYFLIEHMFWIFVRIAPPSKTYVAWRFYAMFLHNFTLTVAIWAKVSWHSNCHYNEFCRCIECRYKEGWLYMYLFRNSSYTNLLQNSAHKGLFQSNTVRQPLLQTYVKILRHSNMCRLVYIFYVYLPVFFVFTERITNKNDILTEQAFYLNLHVYMCIVGPITVRYRFK